MRRLIGTLAVHAILGGALLAMHHAHRPGDGLAATIAIDDVVIAPPVQAARPTEAPRPGGGHPAARARRGAPRGPEPTTTVARIVGDVQIDRGGTGDGDGDGSGPGTGAGPALGTGYGEVPRPPPPPPAARVSRARPARLIFPARQVATAEAELYVVRLEVDDDGFVVGAHLARGFGGKRDDAAMSAVFRFRYDPARDDDGRAIRSTVEQHFDLAR